MVSALCIFTAAVGGSAARGDGLHQLFSDHARSATLLREVWQSSTALHLRAASSANLFSTDELDSLLCGAQQCNRSSHVALTNWSAVRVARGGNATLQKQFRDRPPTLQAVHEAFAGAITFPLKSEQYF